MKEETLKVLKLRFSWFIILLLSAFFLPWFVTVILLLIFVAFLGYPEVVLYGFLLDLLWSPKTPFYARFTFFTSTFIAFFVFRYLRTLIRTNGV